MLASSVSCSSHVKSDSPFVGVELDIDYFCNFKANMSYLSHVQFFFKKLNF